MHIVMVASENDALPGGKVGGLGDVIRDLPAALARAGHQVSVITPDYGLYAAGNPSQLLTSLAVLFGGRSEQLQVHEVSVPRPQAGVRHLVISHPLFSVAGKGRIYVDDDAGPFATDAQRFALFSAATAELLKGDALGAWDVLHCHDWHAATVLLLRACAPGFRKLKERLAVYSIHNLSLQGVRPLRGVASALESWFPGLAYDAAPVIDPAHNDCINLMRTGINLADRVHAVSPTYAAEILKPSDWLQGQVGGEGLEADLQRKHEEGRLIGILNGCEYAEPERRTGRARLWQLIEQALDQWVDGARGNASHHYRALKRLQDFRRHRLPERPCLVSIGRLTDQKLYLLVKNQSGESVMDRLLEFLEPGSLIMLGSGEREYENYFQDCMARHGNFLFLNGYSQALSDALYGYGDLFLMPSIYEPCGISQMLAMRARTPCLVHQVGGLHDTVQDGINGFSFGGTGLEEKQQNLLSTLLRALRLREEDPDSWNRIARAAGQARFLWDDSVQRYLAELYQVN